MAYLLHNGVLDSMKYSVLINKFPKGGIIYKIINNVQECQFHCILTSSVLAKRYLFFYCTII